MAQVLTKRITKAQALDLVRRMRLMDTPNIVIREGLHQQGFTLEEINAILREAHNQERARYIHEPHINPKMMALGLVVITTVMILIVILLALSSIG